MDAFCGSPIWDPDWRYKNGSDIDVTECFQNTVLTWTPVSFLLVVGPLYLYILIASKHAAISQNWLNVTKTILGVVLAILCVMDLFNQIQLSARDVTRYPAQLVAPSLRAVSMALAVLFIQVERRRGVRSSGVLFLHWLAHCIAMIFLLRSSILRFQDNVDELYTVMLFSLILALFVLQLVFANFVDRPPKGAEKSTDKNPCPESHANFLSRITFWWFTALVVQGYRRPLTMDDIYSLNAEDKSTALVPQFLRQWTKEVNQCKKSTSASSAVTEEGIPLQTTNGTGSPGKHVKLESNGDVQVAVKEAKSGKQPSLVKALVRAYGKTFLYGAFFKLIHDILLFVCPQLLKALISFTHNKDEPQWTGFMFAILMFTNAIIQSVVLHQYFHLCFLTGMRIRTALISCIYAKALKLTNAARRTSTVGEIVNLMSVDAQRFMELTTYLNMLWSGPFQMCVCMYFLWQTLGPSILAGVAVMVILIPINAVIVKKQKSLQVQQMKFKDSRIKLMNEVLNGIKVLKLYAWELSFQEKILEIRNKELSVLKKSAYLSALSSFFWTCAPFMVSLTTFAVYVLASDENILDAEKAFVSLSLFNILRFPLSMLPMLLATLVQTSVSIKRLQKFLSNEELDPTNLEINPDSASDIKVESGSFRWEEEETPTLQNINLSVAPGSLVAVVGAVGSGKSSLLSAMLGEMQKVQGKVEMKGSVAYVAQQAWIQNTTLENNILFGSIADKTKYNEVIEGCALLPDLDMLPAGDQTEIGEKGINLSGGQKQRTSMARAVYQNADIYLLDDPLSAVDSHVGKHIFDKVIGPKGMLNNKTRILVTHGLSFLPQVDTIVVLVGGEITEVGSYRELLDKNGSFAEFLRNYLTQESDDLSEVDPDELQIQEEILSHLSMSREQLSQLREEGCNTPKSPRAASRKQLTDSEPNLRKRLISTSSSHHASMKDLGRQTSMISKHKEDLEGTTKEKAPLVKEKEKDTLIQAEKAEEGHVKLSVFVAYMRAMGIPIALLIALLSILNYTASVGANLWLSDWSNDVPINGTVDHKQRDLRLGVYGALGLAQNLASFLTSLVLALGAVRASTRLHLSLLLNCVHAPLSFFETTPLGRVLNRFGQDVEFIDMVLPRNLNHWFKCFMNIIVAIILIGRGLPYILIAFLPLGVFYFFVQRFYVATSRQLKRIESVSRSPIYSHFGETIQGVSTIRAYRQQERFRSESEKWVDHNQMAYFPSIVSNRWLAIRLEFVGNCIVLFAAIFAVLGRDHLSAGIVGLSISYALNITQTLNWMVRMTCELETNIVAVERVKEYSEIPTEADWEIEETKPGPNWPEQGVVAIDNYTTRYREGLDLVLKGIDCQIKSGEKVGIVGRTGAGKSSLTMALFRIIEAAGGSISIDGKRIADLGLHQLRSRITIIPQDPVLFSGTLRMNLDPFDQHSDEALWSALEHAHLKTFVAGTADQLEFECAEEGDNLSVGQRQLVCLARALLRKSRILVLDEATAAVDLETDDLIQASIRTQFAESTVLTIAHRLNTIMDYDRILVLDAGKVVEFDAPQALIGNKQSIFYGMAKDAGLAE